jgi:hypothetical protein
MDALWVVGTGLLIWAVALPFTPAGKWVLLGIADVVAAFGILQAIGLRRLRDGREGGARLPARQGETG